MNITLPYGTGTVEAALDWGRCLGVLEVAKAPALEDPAAELAAALDEPLGFLAPAMASFMPGESVVIVTSDSFRQTGMHQLLPTLIDTLCAQGIRKEDISFLFSTGTHRAPTDEEAEVILGPEIYSEFHTRAYAHDAFDAAGLVEVGTTSRGTPVSLNRRYVEADRRIVTGSVVLHYFAGFGGGRKAIVPGLASEAAIARNHALNLDPDVDRLNPDVRIGVCAGNPVAEDMLEAAQFLAPDLLINTVLNQDQKIAGLFAGEMVAAHDAATSFAQGLYTVPVKEPADFVIASAGGAKNYLQSHKALFNAFQVLKPGGRILFLSKAPEGLGGNKLAAWLGLGDTTDIMAALRERAEINGQTALSTREKARGAYFLTELPDEDCVLLGATRVDTLEAGLAACKRDLETAGVSAPTYYLMPAASQTVPTGLSPVVSV